MATSLQPDFSYRSGGKLLFFNLLGMSGLNLCQCHEIKKKKERRRGLLF